MDNPIEVTGRIATAHYRTELTHQGHLMVSDEPEQDGGTDDGPPPAAFLAASLASCTAITLRMYADRKGWPLMSADVTVSVLRHKDENITRIQRDIILHGDLSATEKQRMLDIAHKCPVHQMLTNPIQITTQLIPDTHGGS
jgi:putative redox protein